VVAAAVPHPAVEAAVEAGVCGACDDDVSAAVAAAAGVGPEQGGGARDQQEDTRLGHR
jgi:hypothetical protein